MKITDEEHGWRLVLGKPLEAFDVDLLFQHYLETICYILRIREACTVQSCGVGCIRTKISSTQSKAGKRKEGNSCLLQVH